MLGIPEDPAGPVGTAEPGPEIPPVSVMSPVRGIEPRWTSSAIMTEKAASANPESIQGSRADAVFGGGAPAALPQSLQ